MLQVSWASRTTKERSDRAHSSLYPCNDKCHKYLSAVSSLISTHSLLDQARYCLNRDRDRDSLQVIRVKDSNAMRLSFPPKTYRRMQACARDHLVCKGSSPEKMCRHIISFPFETTQHERSSSDSPHTTFCEKRLQNPNLKQAHTDHSDTFKNRVPKDSRLS